MQSSELVTNLFQECDPSKGDYHGLCKYVNHKANLRSAKLDFQSHRCWTKHLPATFNGSDEVDFCSLDFWNDGLSLTRSLSYTHSWSREQIPAGIFLPTIAIGACLGRAVGLVTFVPLLSSSKSFLITVISQSMYRLYPKAAVFLSCPPDPSVRCISPGFYAVIGAAAMLGGVTRMTGRHNLTISSSFWLTGGLFSLFGRYPIRGVTLSFDLIIVGLDLDLQLTGALSHVLPIMIVVMTAKWVGDALGTDGIYATWIAMHRYPWLPPVDFKDFRKDTGESIMKSADSLIKIEDGVFTVSELGISAIILLES